MSMEDVVAINMAPDKIVTAMKNGGVDAAAVWSPYTMEILEQVEGTKKLTDNMDFSDESISLASWVAAPEFAEENKGVLVAFTRAIFRLYRNT